MGTLQLIDFSNARNSIPIYHYGWQKSELAKIQKDLQSRYYGNTLDGQFEVMDDSGDFYYAIFRSAANSQWVVKKSKDYLSLKDNNRVLLNIGGKLYRFLMNERTCLDNSILFKEIIENDFGMPRSPYFHSMHSDNDAIMIVVDNEGIAAITWHKVLWKHKFDYADAGYLNLMAIENDKVLVRYYDPALARGKDCNFVFDVHSGNYSEK